MPSSTANCCSGHVGWSAPTAAPPATGSPSSAMGAMVGVALGGPNDPFFDRPLWLQTPCCGHILWAYNSRHLDTLRSYVAADLRERTGPTMGMLDRLPAWIKKANHRTEVLRAIDRLHDQLRHSRP